MTNRTMGIPTNRVMCRIAGAPRLIFVDIYYINTIRTKLVCAMFYFNDSLAIVAHQSPLADPFVLGH